MNNYYIKIYFSNNLYYETYMNSSLDLNEFIYELNKEFNSKDNMFIDLIENDIGYCINRNNVLFYTIEKADKQA